MMEAPEKVYTRVGIGESLKKANDDPITTEIVRNTLNSAAAQMNQVLIRTAFSPVIFEMIDFSAAIYDRKIRMLAQSKCLPIFMGSLSFCIEAAVEAVGGEGNLDEGDMLLYNAPYGTGAHAQDAALVQPAFLDGELIGYTVIKAHWLDIGGRGAYCTDTTDVFQEGVQFPGVKLFKKGVLNDDVFRIIIGNSRVPMPVTGDIRAQAAGVQAGAKEFTRIVKRFGTETFWEHVEHMLDHGEALVRSYFENIPDGEYVESGFLDDNGVAEGTVPFSVRVKVEGSDITVDYTDCAPQQPGPVNSPLPTTVSVTRVAISSLAGAAEAPNEGFFRPITVVTTPGTLFHPLHPAPCFMYLYGGIRAVEFIYKAISTVAPEKVPASSGADACVVVWWGPDDGTGQPWADGWGQPVGHGGHINGDGATLVNNLETGGRLPPIEVWEGRNPWFFAHNELAPDSGGAGKSQGGLGLDVRLELLCDCVMTSTLEGTKSPPHGLFGGLPGRANRGVVAYPDGERLEVGKCTAIPFPKGTVYELYSPGGGGYGEPAERKADDIAFDLDNGYITEDFARQHYPHYFDGK